MPTVQSSRTSRSNSKKPKSKKAFRRIVEYRYFKLSITVLVFMVIGTITALWVAAATTTTSLWSNDTVPATLSSTETRSIELGMRFKSNVAGYVTGMRFYKSAQNTGVHTGNLWDNKGRLLTTVTFTNETASGWQVANFDKPVSVASSTQYVVSYHAPNGHYSYNAKYFSRSAYTSGHLTAVRSSASRPNGLYAVNANSAAFPTTAGNGTNYWVDVLFTTSLINSQPAPAAPTNVNATASSSTSVTTTWQASVSSNPISKYIVYRNGSKLAEVVGGLSYMDTSVSASTTYSYQVQAVDNTGVSSVLSVAASVTTPGVAQTPTSGWPNATNTGVPTGTVLHTCATSITASGTYDACQFNGDVVVRANDVKITRSLINGSVHTGSVLPGKPTQQTGLVISDTTIDCGCKSSGSNGTPSAIEESNFTLLRVNLFNSGHGAAVQTNVTIQDSYIHDLGGNTEDHKDGIFSGGGTNVTVRHNSIECNDGPTAGCTSAIGILTDFEDATYYTIDNNLLNTIGSYCFYGSGGPQKSYKSHHITFTNNHFGRSIYRNCGYYGPVTYFDMAQPGMVWSGNVWDDTGAAVTAEY